MNRITLKNTDLSVSRICYGTGNFKERLSEEAAFEMLDCYTDAGGNFIDTANVYCRWLPDTGNCAEEYIGKWLKMTGKRNRLVLATKGGHPDLNTWGCRVTKKDLERDLDESLKTMGVDCVDFYWFHRDNPNLPIEEVIDMGEEFVKKGKIRYYGASNFVLPRLEEAYQWQQEHPGKGFRALSNQWSLAYPNPGYKFCGDKSLEGVDHSFYLWLEKHGMPLIPYSSTAGGFFAKYSKGMLSDLWREAYVNPRNKELVSIVEEMAKRYQVTPLAISLSVMMEQKMFQVVPVIAVSRKEQLEEILSADTVKISEEDRAIIHAFF